MILSDHDIKRRLESGLLQVSPLDPKDIQPASIDLHLGEKLIRYSIVTNDYQDLYIGSMYLLHPDEFVLGVVDEVIVLPDDLAARLEGKSTLARMGLLVHATAGFVDPGWVGRLTLEIKNIGSHFVKLKPKMPISQISFLQMSSPAERPYGHPDLNSHYQGNLNPEPPKFN